MEMYYDDYLGMYYWAPAIQDTSVGLYDTKKKAIEYAMNAVRKQDV